MLGSLTNYFLYAAHKNIKYAEAVRITKNNIRLSVSLYIDGKNLYQDYNK